MNSHLRRDGSLAALTPMNRGLDMNVRKYALDLKILQKEYDHRDRYGRIVKYGVDWTDDPRNRHIVVRGVKMPYPRTNLKRSNVKILVPENVYDRAPGGGYHFYQNVFIDPKLLIMHPRKKGYVSIPRHYGADNQNWSFLCIHPNGIVRGNKNILDFIRLLQIYLRNVDPDSH